MGDPYQGIKIASTGVLEILFQGGSNWRWQLLYKFRFKDNNFHLIGAESENYFTGDGSMESWSINFISNKVKHTKGNNLSGRIESVNWINLEIEEQRTFDNFIQPMSWNITSEIVI